MKIGMTDDQVAQMQRDMEAIMNRTYVPPPSNTIEAVPQKTTAELEMALRRIRAFRDLELFHDQRAGVNGGIPGYHSDDCRFFFASEFGRFAELGEAIIAELERRKGVDNG